VDFSDFQRELTAAREKLSLVEKDLRDERSKVGSIEAHLARLDADYLAAVGAAIDVGAPDPKRTDPGPLEAALSVARVRAAAFARKVDERRGEVAQLEAQMAQRKREAFLTEAGGAVEAMMQALALAVDRVTEAAEVCRRHGVTFADLPMDLSAPSGCGGIKRPDPNPNMRLHVLRDLPYTFSAVGPVAKWTNPDDSQELELHRIRREAQEREAAKAEADRVANSQRRMMIGREGFYIGGEVVRIS
jgi:hypothetical protein